MRSEAIINVVSHLNLQMGQLVEQERQDRPLLVFADRLPDTQWFRGMLVVPDIVNGPLEFDSGEPVLSVSCEGCAELHYRDPGVREHLLAGCFVEENILKQAKHLEGLAWGMDHTHEEWKVPCWQWSHSDWSRFLRERRERLLNGLHLVMVFAGIATCARQGMLVTEYPLSMVRPMLQRMAPDLARCVDLYSAAQVEYLHEEFGGVLDTQWPDISMRQHRASLLKFARACQSRVSGMHMGLRRLANASIRDARHASAWSKQLSTAVKRMRTANNPEAGEYDLASDILRSAQTEALAYLASQREDGNFGSRSEQADVGA